MADVGQGVAGAGGTAAQPILVVDDDAGARALLSDLLSRAGYTTCAVETGEEALEQARAERPCLVVLDVALPGICGYEVCRELRSALGENLPILFLSGVRTETFDRVAGLMLGGDDYLVKPFAPDELLARVRLLIGRMTPKRAAAPKLTDRELEILRLVAEGLQQAAIASLLAISPKTVATHVEHILGKLGAHTRAQAVAQAYRDGVLGP